MTYPRGAVRLFHSSARLDGRLQIARRAMLWAVGVLGLIGVLNLIASGELTQTERCLASLLILIATIPAFVWTASGGVGPPILAVVGLLYALYYAFPVFIVARFTAGHVARTLISDDAVERSLRVVIVGVSAMIAGYYGPHVRLLTGATSERNGRRAGASVVCDIGILLTLIAVATLILGFKYVAFWNVPRGSGERGAWSWLFDFAIEAGYLGFNYLFVLRLTSRLRGLRLALAASSVGAFALVSLATGAVSRILLLGVQAIFVLALVRHRLPMVLMLMGFAALVILQPMKILYRMTMSRTEEVSVTRSAQELGSATLQVWRLVGTPSFSVRGYVFDRVNFLSTLAACVSVTPQMVPFWHGHSYSPLAFKLIPRLLWQHKPSEDIGQQFPHRYSLLARMDGTTSYKLPQLIEAYINFGMFGVLGVMFSIGCIYRLPVLLVRCLTEEPDTRVVGISYMYARMCDIEANFSLIFGGLYWWVILVGGVAICVRLLDALNTNKSEEASVRQLC